MRSAAELDELWVRNFNATQTRLWLKERAVEYLGGHCQICKYDRCVSALEFHHVDPREKDFEVSAKMGWAVVRPELDKCVLLCANCHRAVHAGLHPTYLAADDEELVDWAPVSGLGVDGSTDRNDDQVEVGVQGADQGRV